MITLEEYIQITGITFVITIIVGHLVYSFLKKKNKK